jgi:hypothetical protein
MSTGEAIVDTLDFAASLSGSSSQISSSDEGASKKLKTTGTYPLNTTDFIPSNKVDVDKALLEKAESEEVKPEKKRAKEAKEAKENEAREGVQKQIEEANLLGTELKEERKKDEEHRLLLQLNTAQWGSLDAAVKANLVDFYYEEEERAAVWWEEEKKWEREREEKREKPAEKRARRANTPGYCEHGRRKRQCKDCGTGLCVHGRWKYICKDGSA